MNRVNTPFTRMLPALGTLACAALLHAAPAGAEGTGSSAGLATPRTLTTQFTYKATLPAAAAGAKQSRLWIPIPSDSEWQTVRDLKVDGVSEFRVTTEPKYGNRMVYVAVANPQTPTAVTISFVVERKEIKLLSDGKRNDSASLERGRDALKSYLEADKNVPLGGRFAGIAKDVAGDKASVLDKARALYEHTVATMQYDYKKESPKLGEGDVAFVCDYKKGNCSDLHSYLISLSRSLGIPAVLEFGFPITGIPLADPLPREGAIAGYHCWTWFKDPEHGWLPLDASDGRRWLDSKRTDVKESLFGNLVLERSAVAFSRGRDLDLVPKQSGPALNYFIYPYAEVDGASVKPTWEVRYYLISAGGAAIQTVEQAQIEMQKQLDALRTEIAALKQAAPGKAAAATAPAVTVPSRESISYYGFARLDAMYDNGLTNNIQTPFFAQSPGNANVAKSGNSQFAMHPRLTRLGINFAAPPESMKDWKITAKLETDWQNGSGLTSESRPLPRIRHAYLQLQHGASSWLFGQTWDIISPLFPSPNDDTLMWNAGNLGDRRPQVRYAHDTGAGINTVVGIGLSGALDTKDLDANGVRDGEDSGLPNLQARIGWKNKTTSLGISGHRAWEKTTKPVAGGTNFDSYSIGLDAMHQITRQWDVKGELWTGSNLSDYRGGIGQGVDPATGNTIRAHGGWAEVGFQTTPKHRVAVGYTSDDTLNKDVPAGGRTRNYALYLHNKWKLATNLDLGVNYLYWETQYKGTPTGIDHRFNWFISHSF